LVDADLVLLLLNYWTWNRNTKKPS